MAIIEAMLKALIGQTYGQFFRRSGLGLRTPDGNILIAPGLSNPTVYFRRWRDFFSILLNPDVKFAEAFADGHIEIENGRIYDVIIRLSTPKNDALMFRLAEYWHLISSPFLAWVEGRTPKQSKANVHAHYDLGNDLYQLFLDKDMQYSCAYFAHDSDSLETAQKRKKQHIINKLLLKPGMTCLDIGCGWGGLSFDLARNGGKVTGLTLSEEQFALAAQRQKKNDLDVEFLLQDYRQGIRQFDRITSVGMFEHVGPAMFRRYFDQVDRNLKPDGIALIHTIGRPKSPRRVSRFITKYIFPGGYIPSLSQITTAVEKTDLLITDVECLYWHYAETLKHWRVRFLENRHIAVKMYDERFARIWEFYLAGCEAAFRTKELTVFQIQLRKRSSPVSMTRDYIYQSPEDWTATDAAPERAHG